MEMEARTIGVEFGGVREQMPVVGIVASELGIDRGTDETIAAGAVAGPGRDSLPGVSGVCPEPQRLRVSDGRDGKVGAAGERFRPARDQPPDPLGVGGLPDLRLQPLQRSGIGIGERQYRNLPRVCDVVERQRPGELRRSGFGDDGLGALGRAGGVGRGLGPASAFGRGFGRDARPRASAAVLGRLDGSGRCRRDHVFSRRPRAPTRRDRQPGQASGERQHDPESNQDRDGDAAVSPRRVRGRGRARWRRRRSATWGVAEPGLRVVADGGRALSRSGASARPRSGASRCRGPGGVGCRRRWCALRRCRAGGFSWTLARAVQVRQRVAAERKSMGQPLGRTGSAGVAGRRATRSDSETNPIATARARLSARCFIGSSPECRPRDPLDDRRTRHLGGALSVARRRAVVRASP